MKVEDLGELPLGWEGIVVGDVARLVQYGTSAKPTEDNEGVPVLRMGNIQDGSLDLSELKYLPGTGQEIQKLILEPGDILFNRTNSPELVGKTALFRGSMRATFASYLIRLRLDESLVVPAFVALWINSPCGRNWARFARTDGVSQSNINSTKLLGMPLPLPPLAEQQRIVAMVEVVLAKVNAARDRLNRVPAILKRFRQAVLSAACSGSLTANWRENHSGPIACENTGIPFGWSEQVVRDVINGIEAGTSFKCLPRRAEGDEWGVIKVSAMTWGVFDEEENKALPSDIEFDSRNEIRSGDILFSRSNTAELAGATVIVGQVRPRLLLSDKSLRLRVKAAISAEWLCRTLQSPDCREQMSEMASGTSNSMRNISQEKLNSIQIPLPPLAEQQEIVRRVEELFAVADRIEARLADARQMADQLTQAVLAKAFRGELVPIEAELARREKRAFESADELLARIRSSRSPTAKTNGSRKARTAQVTEGEKRASP